MSDHVGPPVEARPEPVMSVHERIDAATLLARAQQHGFRLEAPVNIDAIAELLGLRVVEDHSGSSRLIGSIRVQGAEPVVWLNPWENSYLPRRRFTLAHEIGHFCLHLAQGRGRDSFEDDARTFNRDASYWDKNEFEANNFAAELLMPIELINSCGSRIVREQEVRNNALSVDDFVARLAAVLCVSKQSLKYRLENIGLLKPKS